VHLNNLNAPVLNVLSTCSVQACSHLFFSPTLLKNWLWNWSLVEVDTVTGWLVPNILKECDTFIFRVKKFKNAGNILQTTLHHIPVKLNHQQHCSDKLRSHAMYTFCGTRISHHVMTCHWTFTLGYMNGFCSLQNFLFGFMMSLCECILLLKVSCKFSSSQSSSIYVLCHSYTVFNYIFSFCEKGTCDERPHVITFILLFCPPSYIW